MTLFTTLAAAASSAAGGASEGERGSTATELPSPSPNNSSSRPPTAVQLYAGASVDFLSGSVRSDDPSDPRSAFSPVEVGAPSPRRGSNASAGISALNLRRTFEVLSYQAVEAVDPASSLGGGASASGADGGDKGLVRLPGSIQARRGARKHARPNVGVWDCRLSRPDGSIGGGDGGGKEDGGSESRDELIDRLLGASIPPAEDGNAVTFVFAVDLADPQSAYPTVIAMVSSVLRRFEGAEAGSGSGSGFTKLSALRGAAFGAAPSPPAGSSAAPAVPASKDVSLNLVLAVLVPSPRSKKVPTFKDKQAQSLVLYHLHRLAERANCTLAFVRSDGDAIEVEDDAADGGDNIASGMPSITVSELAWAVRRVAMGLPPLEKESGEVGNKSAGAKAEENGTAATEDLPPAEVAPLPPLFAPGSHDPDLIETALLRNASCPGEWDASADDLWKALPPPPTSSGSLVSAPTVSPSKQSKKGALGGDHLWLAELAEGLNAATAGAADEVSTVVSAASGEKSVVKSVKKKPTKKKDKGAKSGAGEKKDGGTKAADPSAFFADLLKK